MDAKLTSGGEEDAPTNLDSYAIRPGTPNDAGAISELATVTFSNSFGWSMPEQDLKAYVNSAYSASAIALELADPRYKWLVACDKSTDSVIGFAQLTQGTSEPCLEGSAGPLIEFQRMYVAAEHHGRGVAKVLFQAAEDIARRMGNKTIWLGVWEDNLKAQRFYEKMGYWKVGTHDFVMGTCVQTDHILKKEF